MFIVNPSIVNIEGVFNGDHEIEGHREQVEEEKEFKHEFEERVDGFTVHVADKERFYFIAGGAKFEIR